MGQASKKVGLSTIRVPYFYSFNHKFTNLYYLFQQIGVMAKWHGNWVEKHFDPAGERNGLENYLPWIKWRVLFVEK
jgi:hypothetical protein